MPTPTISQRQAAWFDRYNAARAAPRATGVLYSEASYFDGYHFQHIADFEEHKRIARIRTTAIKALDRRMSRR